MNHPLLARRMRPLSVTIALMLMLAAVLPGHAQIADRARLVAAMDSAARAHAQQPTVAGISVAVVRGADTLLLRGYGQADIDWSVPTPADASASYEIGSVTKQFTAAAIMQLVEKGKLDLDEDFTKYLPEFDAKGHRVPLRRLLDHTSGIRGYTEMRVFGDIVARTLPRDSLVSLIEAEPFDFEPGTAQIYNNSAYFLLGLIIEKVSGEAYADYVKKQLFEPAGMTDSYYCSSNAIRQNKAHGYDASPGGLVLKAPLDHTWPYAAGSLCSTARDLVRWNRALHGGRILQPQSYRTLTTPVPLVDGSTIGYAMGLGIAERAGKRAIAHGGGINGYLSDASYFPEDELVIVVLQNSTGPRGPGALTSAFTQMLLGPEPASSPASFPGTLDALVGEYAGPSRGAHLHLNVTRDGDHLVVTPAGGRAMRPMHIGNGTWEAGGTKLRFVVADGRAIELRFMQGAGHYVLRRVR